MKKKIIELYRQKRKILVSNEERWKHFQIICIFITLGITSLFMSAVNFFTHQGTFTWVTLGFAIACIIDLFLYRLRGYAAKAALVLFAVEILAIFIYFITSGIPDGFSVLWIAMLPCFGLLMFGMRNGILISILMFLLLIFFFWTPFGGELLMYQYNATFKMRFPILYLAFFVVALLFEIIRLQAISALKESRQKYEFLCFHDTLTGLYNRFWLQTITGNQDKYQIKPSAVAVLDIDNFKYFNDNFGHLNGDIVIREIGQKILETMNGSGDLCRWGGDEFLIFFHTDIDAETVCKRIVDAVRSHEFIFNGEHMSTTLTVGLAIAPDGCTEKADELIRQADINLYSAKDKGKNCTVSSQLTA